MVITPQDAKRFVEKVSFITTPGYLTGPGAREKAGLPKNTGPHKVITNMAILGYDEETKTDAGGIDPRGVHLRRRAEKLRLPTAEGQGNREDPDSPTPHELEILRKEVDPNRYIIGR